MPKMKTRRAAAKRFETTGTGKIVRHKAYKKTTKRKRNLRKAAVLDQTNRRQMKRCMPYA